MLTVLEILKKTTEFLEKRGVESARLNSELLIGHALELKRMQLYLQFERPLTEQELDKIRPLVKRRGLREPLQYILGEVEFSGAKLKVDPRALIPRPETEHLIELIIAELPNPPAKILDLGTGSGAIAIALAGKYPQAGVVAVDRSAPALGLARENVQAAGLIDRVQLVESDWFAAVPRQSFDLIVSNPPYLSDAEVAEASPEVKDHEPADALSAGADSALALERILTEARAYLSAGALLACETGIDHAARLIALAEKVGYARTRSVPDLTGRARYLLAFA